MAKALLSIGDYELPDPAEYEGLTSTLVDSSRNAKGVVIGQVIREDVAKVTVSWKFLPADVWSNVLKKFSTAHGGSFINEVTFFDQTLNDWNVRQMYVSDRSAKIMRVDENGVRGFVNCKLSLVEV